MRRIITLKFLFLSLCVALFLDGCSELEHPSLTETLPVFESTATIRPPATNTPSPRQTPQELPTTVTETQTVIEIKSVTDNATFLGENFPDNSILTPGEAFVKTWEIKNIGTIPWSTSYQLVAASSSEVNLWGNPVMVNFPHDTAPGESVQLSVQLTAPSTPGIYTLFWIIKNETGEVVSVDGDRLWVKIQVCETKQSCSQVVSSGTSTSSSNVTINITNFAYNFQNATVNYCISISGLNDWRALRAYSSWPTTPKLFIDQKAAPFQEGGSDFSSGDGCSYMVYKVTAAEIEQAQKISLVIDTLRMGLPPGDPNVACEAARATLLAQYPGLNFQCDFSMAGYFTNLQSPSGMSWTDAVELINATIEGAIYGPWTLILK